MAKARETTIPGVDALNAAARKHFDEFDKRSSIKISTINNQTKLNHYLKALKSHLFKRIEKLNDYPPKDTRILKEELTKIVSEIVKQTFDAWLKTKNLNAAPDVNLPPSKEDSSAPGSADLSNAVDCSPLAPIAIANNGRPTPDHQPRNSIEIEKERRRKRRNSKA